MRIRKISSWLGPSFGGSLFTAWTATTILGLVGPIDPLLGNRFWNWVAGMLVATPLSLMLSVVLISTDVALVRFRVLPVGGRAWWMSAVAPLLVGLGYMIHRPGDHDGGLGFLCATLAPMIAASFLTRWFGGTPRSARV